MLLLLANVRMPPPSSTIGPPIVVVPPTTNVPVPSLVKPEDALIGALIVAALPLASEPTKMTGPLAPPVLSSVSELVPLTVQPAADELSESPKLSVPTVRALSRLTTMSPVGLTELKLAVPPAPLAMPLFSQFNGSPQLKVPGAVVVQVPSADKIGVDCKPTEKVAMPSSRIHARFKPREFI